jgi:transposase
LTLDLLRLPGLRAVGQYVDNGDLIVEVEGTVGVRHNCSLLCRLVKMGRAAPSRFRDHPIQGQPTWLELKRQRFACRFDGCTKTPYEDLPDLDTERRMTVRFRRKIEEDAVALTFVRAADVNGVHETLVRRVFDDLAKRKLTDYRVKLPRVICIDEKVIHGVPCLTLGDGEARTMLDMRPSRIDKDIRPYFAEMRGRDQVQVVCQDMWRGYRIITRDLFPNARTVIDKFHAVRMADWGVEVVRKSLYHGMAAADRKSLKRSNKLLKVRLTRATDEQAERLHAIFGEHPMLLEAYLLREQLYDVYESQTRAEAERRLDLFLAGISKNMERPFKQLITGLKNWRPYILNYFDHRFTNAYVERLNGLIDVINREGAGLSFDTLRAKAMLRYSTLREEPYYKRVPRDLPAKEPRDLGWAVALDLGRPKFVQQLAGATTIIMRGIPLSTFERGLRDGLFAA